MEKLNENCPCKSVKCPNHGNCKACQANHAGGKTTCQRLNEKQPRG